MSVEVFYDYFTWLKLSVINLLAWGKEDSTKNRNIIFSNYIFVTSWQIELDGLLSLAFPNKFSILDTRKLCFVSWNLISSAVSPCRSSRSYLYARWKEKRRNRKKEPSLFLRKTSSTRSKQIYAEITTKNAETRNMGTGHRAIKSHSTFYRSDCREKRLEGHFASVPRPYYSRLMHVPAGRNVF